MLEIEDLLEMLNKQHIIGTVKIIELFNYEYDEDYLTNLWLHYSNQNKMNSIIQEIYDIIKPFFEILYNTNEQNLSLSLIPNKMNHDAFTIMKVDNQFYCLHLECDEKRKVLINEYINMGLSGNLVAIYLLK